MDDIFITSIETKGLRNIPDTEILLSETERKHLIVTGKNGCGKTTFLNEIDKAPKETTLNEFDELFGVDRFSKKLAELKLELRYLDKNTVSKKEYAAKVKNIREIENDSKAMWIDRRINIAGITEYESPLIIQFNKESYGRTDITNGNYLFFFFQAKRSSDIDTPSGINKTSIDQRIDSKSSINKQFLQYLANKKVEKSFARDDGDFVTVKRIDDWFMTFTSWLRDIFDNPTLELEFDRKNYNFKIIEEGKEPYTFNQLSDGFSSIMDIITELILRMEAHGGIGYEREGVVLIDEIETHLHVDLQKKILPFLTSFFPKIQFIVSTHSPFVLTSVPNAVVWDMHSGKILNEDLTALSSSALTESYFDVDEYSNLVKNNVATLETLSLKTDSLTPEEESELLRLEEYFAKAPELSDELQIKLHQIKRRSAFNEIDISHSIPYNK
ncbi:MAG: AAA family ATPase [Magnetococcales bacterium]|nr:AAA family ATPase [Magnetococcales bacterium]